MTFLGIAGIAFADRPLGDRPPQASAVSSPINPGVRVSPNKFAITHGDCGNNGEKFLCLPLSQRCLCPALMFEMSLGTGQFMRRFALGAIAALFLVGCTTSPPTPSATVNAQQIIYTIVTELYCSTKAIPSAEAEKRLQPGEQLTNQDDIYFASLDNWVVGVDLYLSASVEASVSPSLSLLGPFNLAKAIPAGGTTGTFTSAFGGSFDQTRTNLREYKIYLFMPPLILGSQAQQYQMASIDPTKPHVAPIQNWGNFAGANCDNSGGTYGRNSGNTYLVGRLGLKDWLEPAVYAQEASHQYSPLPKSGSDTTNGTSAGSAQNPTIGETITFTIKAGELLARVCPNSGERRQQHLILRYPNGQQLREYSFYPGHILLDKHYGRQWHWHLPRRGQRIYPSCEGPGSLL